MERWMKWIALSCWMGSSLLYAAPEGFKLISGDASPPTHDGAGTTTIRGGEKAIIHWDQFSVDKSETVRFQLAGSKSAVLNRVIGGQESRIMGLLSSNGRVYLVNPSGVFIGPEGRIDTAGFVASTLDLLDEDFLHRNDHLFLDTGSSKGIINLGTIRSASGDITLIGRTVENKGSIEAPNGAVTLASGIEILLKPAGARRAFIRASTSDGPAQEGAAIDHSGKIQALSAELVAGANPYAKAIHSTGEIEALALRSEGGRIYLVADEGISELDGGKLYAKNESGIGGNIHILGDKVGILGEAQIDISGKTGGGTLLVGGDFQGKNPDIKNAEITFVSPQSTIKADALENGDGGRVIIWSDHTTRSSGKISARGGPVGGDGGFVEISGHALEFHSFVDRRAPFGKSGTLLLDPNDITISNAPTSGFMMMPPPYSGGTTPCNINGDDLVTNLNMGNISIATGPGTGGTGLITIDAGTTALADGSWTHNTLTLEADSTITVNGAILTTSVAPSTLTITSALNVIINASIHVAGSAPNSQDIQIQGISAVSASFDGVAINATVTCDNGDIFIRGTSGLTGGNGVHISSTGGVEATKGNILFSGLMGTASFASGVFVDQATINAPMGSITFDDRVTGLIGTRLNTATLTGTSISFDTLGNGGTGQTYSLNAVDSTIGSEMITSSIIADPSSLRLGGILLDGCTLESFSSIILIGKATIASGAVSGQVGLTLTDTDITVSGDGGTLNLQGFGGGNNANATTGNSGLVISGGTLTLGQGGMGTLNQIALQGQGGNGTGGEHHGVQIIDSLATWTLLGTNPSNAINIIAAGGSGSSGGNIGMSVDAPLTVTGGTLNVSADGGTSTSINNYGFFLNDSALQASNLIIDAQGGTGSGTGLNYGFYAVGTNASISGGPIDITGTSGTGTTSIGCLIANSTDITATGSNNIDLTGTGDTYAIFISGAGVHVTTVNGDLTLDLSGSDTSRIELGATVGCTGSGDLLFSGNSANELLLGSCTIEANSGDITFDPTPTLVANGATINEGSGILSIPETITGAFGLTIDLGGGIINSLHVAISSLDITGTGTISGAADLLTSGDINISPSFGGAGFDAVSTEGGIKVATIISTSDVSLQVTSNTTDGIPDGIIVLNGPISTPASVVLTANRTAVPKTATITGNPSGGNVSITADILGIGNNEALTVYGSVTIDCSTGMFKLAQVGDIVATGPISIDADTINVYLQLPADILNSDGDLVTDPNTCIISPASVSLSQTPTESPGDRAVATIGVFSFTQADLKLGNPAAGGYVLNYNPLAVPVPVPDNTDLRLDNIYLLNTALAELTDNLPIYWPPYHWVYVGQVSDREHRNERRARPASDWFNLDQIPTQP